MYLSVNDFFGLQLKRQIFSPQDRNHSLFSCFLVCLFVCLFACLFVSFVVHIKIFADSHSLLHITGIFIITDDLLRMLLPKYVDSQQISNYVSLTSLIQLLNCSKLPETLWPFLDMTSILCNYGHFLKSQITLSITYQKLITRMQSMQKAISFC